MSAPEVTSTIGEAPPPGQPALTWSPLRAGILPAVAAAAVAVLYDDPLLLLTMLLAAATAGAIPVILTERSPALAGPLALLTLVGLLVLLAVLAGGGVGPTGLLTAVTAAVPRMLSFAPPIPTRLETLAPVVVVVWAGAFAAASLHVRRWRLAAAGPSVVVLIAALLLVGRAAPVPGWVAPLLGVGVLVVLLDQQPTLRLGLSGRERNTLSVRRPVTGTNRTRMIAAIGMLVAVTLIASGVVLSHAVHLGNQVDLRARYQPQLEQPEPIDPLTRLAGWAKGDQQVLATVRVDQAPNGERPIAWRWAILDQFDGARWTSSLRYRPTGQRLRGATGSTGTTGLVRAAVRTSPTLEPWLPTPGTVRALSTAGLAVSGGNESVMGSGRSAIDGYGVVADATLLDGSTARNRSDVAALSASESDGADTFVVPQLPEQLRRMAQAVADRAGTSDGQRALVLQDLLHDNGQFVTDAPAGHLYLRLVQFVTDQDPNVRLKGTSEQFATAFAVLARALGLPTRVVVGFSLPPAPLGRDQPVAADRMQAWPEVHFAGAGWVRFEPTPEERGSSNPQPKPSQDDILNPNQQAQPSQVAAPSDGSDRRSRAPARADSLGSTVLPITLTLLIGALLIFLTVVALLRVQQRSSRRRRADARDGVLGAWLELQDALHLAEARTSPHTVRAVTERVAVRLGATAAVQVQPLGQAANRAAFAVGESLRPEDAERAWAVSDDLVAGLRRGAPRSRRYTWWFRPAPLRRRR